MNVIELTRELGKAIQEDETPLPLFGGISIIK